MTLSRPCGGTRPAPYSHYTTPEFWNDPHISARMLAFHLDDATPFSSRPFADVDRAVAWLARRFAVGPGTRVLDLGCGPGLYASRLARLGAAVVGVDVSARSIAHARGEASGARLDARYLEGNYLDVALPTNADLVLLIYRDYCALSPAQRRVLIRRAARALAPGGAFVFDVQAAASLADCVEETRVEENLDEGFWAAEPYVGCHERFVYPDDMLVLDRFTIAEANRTRVFYNWNQFLTPDGVATELARAGMAIDSVVGDLAGGGYEPDRWEFAVVARRV